MDKGTYALKIKVSNPVKVKVGAIGEVDFKKGTYIYVGSAMNSLSKRIERHLRKKKKLHWHIDYLLSCENVNVEKVYVFFGKRLEEDISIKLSGMYESVKNFGASDMKWVDSNLYFVDDKIDDFINSLGGVEFEKDIPSHG